MSRALKVAFLKVLAAVAWADGAVEPDERNRIKVLFNRFGLDPSERKPIDALLDRPVSFDKAVALTKDFAGRIAPPGARRELLVEIEAMLGDEESRAPEEGELLEHVRAILSSHTVLDGLTERFRGLFSRTLFARGRSENPHAGTVTEGVRNSALARLADLSRQRGRTLEGHEADWNRATLVGVLLARIVHVDEGWSGREREVVERALAGRFGLDDFARELLLTVMDEEVGRDTDLQRICSEYCRISTMEQRLEDLEVLFEVAVADDRASKEEIEEIRRIADLLWISRPEYFAVRDRYRDRIES
jgi:uncharacterized tellurite resistance protein B-like protein